MQNTIILEAPRENWVELWRAPFQFRATYNNGIYGAGSSLEELPKPHQHSKIATLALDPTDASLVIHWSWQTKGKAYSTVRRYSSDGGPTHAQLAKIKSGEIAFPHFQFFPGNIPENLCKDAVNVITGAVSLRSSLLQEFKWAVDAGVCKIFARVGSRTAPFKHIPADIFQAYKITSWGSGLVGQSEATLDGEPTLYALYAVGESDAARLAYWDIIPAISWVAHRSIDVVNHVISECTKEDKGLRAASQYIGGNATNQAEEILFQALARGEIKAWGLKNGEGDYKKIEKITWSDAHVVFGHYGPEVRPKNHRNLQATYWHNVRLAAKDVRALWPSLNDSNIKEPPPEKLIARNSKGRPKKSGTYDSADAALFPEIDKHINDPDNPARSLTEAARRIAGKISGGGTEASKIDRMVRKYRRDRETGENRE